MPLSQEVGEAVSFGCGDSGMDDLTEGDIDGLRGRCRGGFSEARRGGFGQISSLCHKVLVEARQLRVAVVPRKPEFVSGPVGEAAPGRFE